VTGTGQALGTQQSDAFHVFTTVDDFVSDDFLSTTLDARWSFLDPRDDSSLTLDGTRLQFNVPSGTSHDVWSGGNFAPRVLQPMDDADFALEAKFETLPSQQYQLQGILVEAASDDYIRFDTYSDGTNLRIFAATFDPNPTVKISEVIASPTTPLYLRVARSGDVWTMTYSFDRQTWHSPTGHTFAHALAVSQAGLFAGNAGSSPPAFTAQFDYLVNLACPGNPDDQHPLRPAECATQPQDGTLWINGAPATVLLPGQQAPTYRADHTYQVTIDAAGEPLVFGVGDSNVRDNSGSYEVTICPATSSSPLTTTTRLSAGFAHTCHITEAGGLACWGDDSYGQRTNLPTDTDFVQISAGQRHTCALRQGGQVACWGDDTYGQVSAPPSGSFTQVSAGWTHSCAVQSDGSIACWGDNTYGQAPASVTDASYTQVSAGQDVTCGVTSEQHLACWGRTTFGQRTPSAGLFQQVSAGRDFACGLHTDGSIQCWGNTFHAQVSARPDGTSPHFTQVQAGNAHVCAVSNAGDLVCWGWDDFNQTSDADTATGTYSEVSAGGAHTCALQANGTLACWGQNDDEQASPPTP
jgi:regulation of enolase protein 1 (concanavalin A-like superfamily)